MNNSITLKITLALFFVIICQASLRAQDTTKKMILVVRPGQTNTPASTKPASSSTTSNPLVTGSAPDNTEEIPMPVRTAPMDHPVVSAPVKVAPEVNAANGKKTVMAPGIPAKIAPVVSPAMVPPVKGSAAVTTGTTTGPANSTNSQVKALTSSPAATKPAPTPAHTTNASGYTAPSTAERSVTPTLVPRKVAPPIMVPVKPSELQANNANKANTPASGGASTSANTATVVVPPVVTPAKKDSLIAKKDTTAKKDSLIAKKDTTKKDSLLAKKDTSSSDTIGFQKQRIAFLEIGGPGLAISANYDMRVQIGTSNKLFGFRAGVGYFQSGNNWVFTVPLQANYLYGKDGKYLEFGLGTTFLVSRGDNYSSKNFIFDNDTGFIATGTIGVRYAPKNSPVNFRLAYVPIIDSDGLVNIGGFSVGYTF